MLNLSLDYKYLFLSEQGYAEEVTGEVMISLMSMMRIKYELGPGAMEISEVLQEPSDFKSREEEENMYNLKKESEAEKSYGTPIQSKIEVFFNVHTGKADLNKKRSTYRSYNPNQIGCFLLLVIEKFPVKTAAADAGINLSSTYWFKKLEKKAQFSQTKKDGLIKGSWPT